MPSSYALQFFEWRSTKAKQFFNFTCQHGLTDAYATTCERLALAGWNRNRDLRSRRPMYHYTTPPSIKVRCHGMVWRKVKILFILQGVAESNQKLMRCGPACNCMYFTHCVLTSQFSHLLSTDLRNLLICTDLVCSIWWVLRVFQYLLRRDVTCSHASLRRSVKRLFHARCMHVQRDRRFAPESGSAVYMQRKCVFSKQFKRAGLDAVRSNEVTCVPGTALQGDLIPAALVLGP